MATTIEPIQEGWLVKGTTDIHDAHRAVVAATGKECHTRRIDSGYFRKIPGQWSNWWLHKTKNQAPERGAFRAVAIWVLGTENGQRFHDA